MDASWDDGVSCSSFFGHFHLDLISRINLFGAYPILFEVGIPNLVYGSLDGDMLLTIFGSL